MAENKCMGDQWYVRTNGGIDGPMDRQSLLNAVRLDELADSDHVSEDGLEWISVAELRSSPAFSASPPTEPIGETSGDIFDSDEPGSEPQDTAEGMAGARDQIVILGRRRSGKTVYLSSLYEKLWRSLDGITMSALSGIAHRNAMRIAVGLREGRWPPGTLENVQVAFEVEYRDKKRVVTSMDYSGEIFRKAFVEDDRDSPEVKELLSHLDNAGAIMLLVDASTIYEHSRDIDAEIDDDFGMVQAVKRVRNWPGCEDVPICMVLTKWDQNRSLVLQEGTCVDFVKKHYPALARTLKRVRIFGVSVVQTEEGPDGKMVPAPSSKPVDLVDPLNYCLQHMHEHDEVMATRRKREDLEQNKEARRALKKTMALRQRESDKRAKIIWTLVIVGMIMTGILIIALLVVYRG